MKKSFFKITLLVIMFGIGFCAFGQSVSSNLPKGMSISTYYGTMEALEAKGYTPAGMGGIINVPAVSKNGRDVWANASCKHSDLGKLQHDCFLWIAELTEKRDTTEVRAFIPSRPKSMIHIKLSMGWEYFYTLDHNCKSDDYPEADIVAIGKSKSHKRPLLKGDVYAFAKAWRKDYHNVTLVEIPVKTVSCGYTDDRN
jgi:hypothetical protein